MMLPMDDASKSRSSNKPLQLVGDVIGPCFCSGFSLDVHTFSTSIPNLIFHSSAAFDRHPRLHLFLSAEQALQAGSRRS